MSISSEKSSIPSRIYPWYVVVVLLLAYVCSFIDRNVINLLVTSIKEDLSLSDTQISLLQGVAFAFFYVTFGLLISRLADKYNRVNLITLGLVLWCLATASGGLASSFGLLFLARMAVGIGESSLTPSATSLLSDTFPPKRLGLAMSLYAGGPYVGSGLALILGGALIDYLGAQPQIIVPVLGDLRPWQAAFFIVGLPGLSIGALVFFTVREPVRKEFNARGFTRDHMPSVSEFIGHVKSNLDVYGLLFFGSAMASLIGYGFSSWAPTYYVRQFGMSNSEVGGLLGTSILIGGVIGVISGGIIGDWMRRSRIDAPIVLWMIAGTGNLIFGIAALLVDSAELSLLLIVPMYIAKNLPVGVIYVALHLITPNRMRAQVVALYLFVDASIGLGFGPTAVALCTDYVFRDEALLGNSLLTVLILSLTASLICAAFLRKRFAILASKHTVSE